MNEPRDHDLKARFAALRRDDHAAAPAWHPRLLRVQKPESTQVWKWAFAAIFAALAAFWLLRPVEPVQPAWADFPPLLENESAPLFASLQPDSTDFLLPTHLTIDLP